MTNRPGPYIIRAVARMVDAEERRKVGGAFRSMAGKSAAAVRLRTAALVLITLGLVGCVWALIGYYRVRSAPASPAVLAMPLPSLVPSSSPTMRPTETLQPSPSPTVQPTVTPLPSPSPTARPTITPLPSPSPTARPTITPLPSAEPTPTTPEVSSQGAVPEKGALAPDFALPNAQGGTFTLSDLRDQRKVVLVFYRTAG